MTKQERVAGMVLMLLGAAVTGYTLCSLQLGTIQKPGPGLFPFVCGIGIVILCAIWLYTNKQEKTRSEPFWQECGQWHGPLLALIMMTGYALAMEPLGYVFSTFVFLVAWQKIVVSEKWIRTSIIASVGTIGMYVLFAYLLGLVLPEGIFGI